MLQISQVKGEMHLTKKKNLKLKSKRKVWIGSRKTVHGDIFQGLPLTSKFISDD